MTRRALIRVAQRAEARGEQGFTLVELLVYGLLSMVVLSIVGGLLINSLTTHRTVRSAAEAANTGQLILRTIEHGIRNASAVAVTDGGRLLVARTAGATSTDWSCQAWYYDDSGDGTLYTTTASDAAGIVPGDAATSWMRLGEGVSGGAASVFSPLSPPGVNAVTVSLRLTADGSATVALQTTVHPRLDAAETGSCF